MPAYKRRKRLTERVAERQSGKDAEPESRSRRLSRTGATFGYAISLIGLGLLAYEALMVAQGSEMSITTLAIYAGLPTANRAIREARAAYAEIGREV